MLLWALCSVLTVFTCSGNCTTSTSSAHSGLEVKTESGVLYGFVNSSTPSVRQFLGIPFSLPPTGAKRWLRPLKLQSNAYIPATNIGPACPQLLITSGALNTSVFSPNGGEITESFPLETFSEDCLTLNVWAPDNQLEAMPVFVWFFGGGFIQGGTSSPFFNPQSWVQRTREHIVVTVNFRSNIFGFPNAIDLEDQNLGLLDQRLALEWVRDNIAKFGGDPLKIVAWGESAGAIAIDYLNLAYPDDPIVSGNIMGSGTALFEPQSLRLTSDTTYSNFTTVAKAFNCTIAARQTDCLRNVSWQTIERYLGTEAAQHFTFLPVADERVVFQDYPQRYEISASSLVPAIIGSNQHELNVFKDHASADILDALANKTFLCTAAKTSQLRQAYSRTTYRYRYDGDFSNISPAGFPGAYHSSELPLIFGTAGNFHGESTIYEDIVGVYIQDLWLEFAKDPENGLKKASWGPYSESRAVILGDVHEPLKHLDVSELDSVCASL